MSGLPLYLWCAFRYPRACLNDVGQALISARLCGMSFAISVYPRHAPAARSEVFLAVAAWSHVVVSLWKPMSSA